MRATRATLIAAAARAAATPPAYLHFEESLDFDCRRCYFAVCRQRHKRMRDVAAAATTPPPCRRCYVAVASASRAVAILRCCRHAAMPAQHVAMLAPLLMPSAHALMSRLLYARDERELLHTPCSPPRDVCYATRHTTTRRILRAHTRFVDFMSR